MSRDARLWLDRFSDADTPPSLTLRRADGARIATLVENRLDDTHPYGPYRAAHVPTRFGTLRAADGQVLHWQMLVPPGLAAGQRAPAIVEVYGGPGVQRVQRAWSGTAGLYQQTLAQAGYVIRCRSSTRSGSASGAGATAGTRRCWR
jgi:dipeptidyl-peptidase-4